MVFSDGIIEQGRAVVKPCPPLGVPILARSIFGRFLVHGPIFHKPVFRGYKTHGTEVEFKAAAPRAQDDPLRGFRPEGGCSFLSDV